jgi:uncharacterized alkaline shock family protein YloU
MTGMPGSAVARPLAVDVDERGRLGIHPTVLRKIVGHAIDQVAGTLRHERRLAGIDVGEVGAKPKIVTGVGDASSVEVQLELILQYPAAIRSVVDAVRIRVGDELGRVAGCRLRAFKVPVSGLRGATAPRATRLH